MAILTIRSFDDEMHKLLRIRAAHNGRSMEAEARLILSEKLTSPLPSSGLGSRIHARFADIGGADDLPLPGRDELAATLEFPE